MEVGQQIRRFVENLAVQFAVDVVRGYLLHRLEDITAADCYTAIKNKVNLWSITPDSDKIYIMKKVLPRFRKLVIKYLDDLTPRLVLEWLRRDRPDLADVIEKKNQWAYADYEKEEAYKWLASQVENIKANIKAVLSSEGAS